MALSLVVLAMLVHGTAGKRVTSDVTSDVYTDTESNNVCHIKEKADHEQYGLSFRYKTSGKGGCSRVKCTTFRFVSDMLPKILIGSDEGKKCACWNKDGIGKTADETHLFNFIKREATCDSSTCWKKYTEVLYTMKKNADKSKQISISHHPASLNHFEAECESVETAGAPTLSFTTAASMLKWVKKKGTSKDVSAVRRLISVKEEVTDDEVKIDEAVDRLSPPEIVTIKEDPEAKHDDGTTLVEDELEEVLPIGRTEIETVKAPIVKMNQVVTLAPGQGICRNPRTPFSSANCGNVKSAEDCEEAAGKLGMKFTKLKRAMKRMPGGCFARMSTSFAIWNPHTGERQARRVSGGNSMPEELLCACYETVQPPEKIDVVTLMVAEAKMEETYVAQGLEEPSKKELLEAAPESAKCDSETTDKLKAECMCGAAEPKGCLTVSGKVSEVTSGYYCAVAMECEFKSCKSRVKKCAARRTYKAMLLER